MSSEPRHLHPAAMLIDAIKTVRRSLSAFVIPGIAFLMSRGFDAGTIALVLLGALVVAVLAAFWGFLSWRATTYEVAGGVFRLRWGVVQKNERVIPLDHVQSVDTVQGIIQRLFNVVEVRIETAGGGAGEPDASLAALDRADAEALRHEIAGSRREPVETQTAGPTVVRKLGTRDLLLAGATSGQIGVALSLIAVASSYSTTSSRRTWPSASSRPSRRARYPPPCSTYSSSASSPGSWPSVGRSWRTPASRSRATGTSCTSGAGSWRDGRRRYRSPASRPSV